MERHYTYEEEGGVWEIYRELQSQSGQDSMSGTYTRRRGTMSPWPSARAVDGPISVVKG